MSRLLYLVACLPLVALATDVKHSPLDYLKKMGQSLQSLNYHGTLVYIHDGQVESLQLIHKNDAGKEFERLVHLSGEPREVIRDNDVVTCYLPDSQSVVVGQRLINNHLVTKLTTNLDQFAPNYSFEINGNGRVAGRNAKIIKIQSKDPFRYSYNLWIDEATALLLKTELVDKNGEILEQMMFAQIEVVDTIPDSMLQPGISGEKLIWHGGENEQNKSMDVDPGWHVADLPKGFVLSGHYKQSMPDSTQPADHMIISDGLASVSVYIEPFNAESQAFVGASRMGAVNVFGSVFEDHKVTVIGEVPSPTVERISQSLRYQPQNQQTPLTPPLEAAAQ